MVKMLNKPTTEKEVQGSLKHLDLSKATGPGGIPRRLANPLEETIMKPSI